MGRGAQDKTQTLPAPRGLDERGVTVRYLRSREPDPQPLDDKQKAVAKGLLEALAPKPR